MTKSKKILSLILVACVVCIASFGFSVSASNSTPLATTTVSPTTITVNNAGGVTNGGVVDSSKVDISKITVTIKSPLMCVCGFGINATSYIKSGSQLFGTNVTFLSSCSQYSVKKGDVIHITAFDSKRVYTRFSFTIK